MTALWNIQEDNRCSSRSCSSTLLKQCGLSDFPPSRSWYDLKVLPPPQTPSVSYKRNFWGKTKLKQIDTQTKQTKLKRKAWSKDIRRSNYNGRKGMTIYRQQCLRATGQNKCIISGKNMLKQRARTRTQNKASFQSMRAAVLSQTKGQPSSMSHFLE